jgi:hypothetical protein
MEEGTNEVSGAICFVCGMGQEDDEEEEDPHNGLWEELGDRACSNCFRTGVYVFPVDRGYQVLCPRCRTQEIVDRQGVTVAITIPAMAREEEEEEEFVGNAPGNRVVVATEWEEQGGGCPWCYTSATTQRIVGGGLEIFCPYCHCICTVSRNPESGELRFETFWCKASESDSESDGEEGAEEWNRESLK